MKRKDDKNKTAKSGGARLQMRPGDPDIGTDEFSEWLANFHRVHNQVDAAMPGLSDARRASREALTAN